MTIVNTLSVSPPKTPGSKLLKRLPNTIGEEREQALLEMYLDGEYPMWLRQWHEVPVEHDGLKGAFYVLPDFLCLGTNDDYIYTPMGALYAEKVLSAMTAVLPTQRMVELIYAKSKKQVAQPWGPPYDRTMTYTSRWPVQTSKVVSSMKSMGVQPGDLVEGHFKNVIVSSKAMRRHGTHLGFFGWYRNDGKPIQGDSLEHGAAYCDYSHGIRAVLSTVVVGDMLMTLREALDHDEAYKLFSHEKVSPSSYRVARALREKETGLPLPVLY